MTEFQLKKINEDLPTGCWSPIKGWWAIPDLISNFKLKVEPCETILDRILFEELNIRP